MDGRCMSSNFNVDVLIFSFFFFGEDVDRNLALQLVA